MKTKEEKAEYNRQWREKNRERHDAYQRAYSKKHSARKVAAAKEHRRLYGRSDSQSPVQTRRYRLKHVYSLTVEQWDAMLIAQAGRCAACTAPHDRD